MSCCREAKPSHLVRLLTPERPSPLSLSHEFDGEHVYGKIGHFQLCDISDPLLKSLIDSPDGVLSACSSDPNEGWYAYDYLEQIRQILRRKWQGLLNGVRVSTAECEDLLAWELSKQSRAGQPKRSRASMAGTGTGANGGKGGKGSGRRRGRSGTGANSSDDDDDDDSAVSRSRDASSSSASDTGSRPPRRGGGGGGPTGAGSDVWRSDQTSDDDDSLDSADEAAYAARRRAKASASGTRTLRSNARRAGSTGGGVLAGGENGGHDDDGGGGEEESSPGPGPSSPSTSANGGTPAPRAGPSGATTGQRKKGSSVVVAPWDRPKKKRPSAKQPETEAELVSRTCLSIPLSLSLPLPLSTCCDDAVETRTSRGLIPVNLHPPPRPVCARQPRSCEEELATCAFLSGGAAAASH